ncbi:hypothetical protein MHU86_16490 [Fragilaria crotonensis]|nr:hypothetical protein MHU86_16490 [Fragilaria crotonensis]
MKTVRNLFINQKHQIIIPRWIGVILQIHQSHLTLMLLTAPTCQSSLTTKRTLPFMRTLLQSSFAGITVESCRCQNAKHGLRGLFSKKLAKCQVPTCTSCLYGKPPEDHGEPSQRVVNKVENFEQPQSRTVSASISWSPVPRAHCPNQGLAHQERYKVATIFVDHFSGLSYIHLQKSTNADETLEAKLAFERYASKFKVQVKSYQVDNGRFAENKFMACQGSRSDNHFLWSQCSFSECCGRKKDQTLQDQARTMLIHAQHMA